jgi:CRP-like cAMP-binding protein
MDITELVGAVQTLNAEDAFRPRLSLEQWRMVAQYLTPHEIRGGDMLIRQGDVDRTMYLLARRTLQMFTCGAGAAPRVAVLRAGSLVGETTLFLDGPHLANVEAMGPCTVWALRAPRFEELAQRQPPLALEIARAAGGVMARRLLAAAQRTAAGTPSRY